MTIYTATFRTADTWATEEIDAATPAKALRKARRLAARKIETLYWCAYDPSSVPLEEIEIIGTDGQAVWQSEDLALRLASSDLLDALNNLTGQIDSLEGVSSCVDENIIRSQPYRTACKLVAKLKTRTT